MVRLRSPQAEQSSETTRDKKIIDFTITKVKELFEKYPVPGHGFDHSEIVANYAREIAVGEKNAEIFLAELAGYLHDIGRTAEHYELGYQLETNRLKHHELSYIMLRDWFKDEPIYSGLNSNQKTIILYAVRNHWNNAADRFPIAWILRDADKLDMFGEHGLQRHIDFAVDDESALAKGLRYNYDSYYWIHTKTARDIIEKNNLMEPINNYYINFLKERIKEVDD